MDAGRILAEVRRGAGLSQRRLALRAGTSQDAISRVERGNETPGLDRLRRLVMLCGAELEVSLSTSGRPDGGDPGLDPAQRLRESASWNLAATTLELAAERARDEGHPATRVRA